MRFFTFIETSQQEILNEWDKFAKTLFPEQKDSYMRRDHAAEMLAEIAADMQTDQSAQEQINKSRGVVSPFHPEDSAASVHGVSRSSDGLDISQLASEFRSLRAIVMRLWLPKLDVLSQEVINDIVRFNESIDEALADSIISYSANC